MNARAPVYRYEPKTWVTKAQELNIDPAKPVYAIGFNLHWRRALRRFLQGATLKFVSDDRQVPAGHVGVVWGKRPCPTLADGCQLLRLEDGFLRSVGLGAQFTQPVSWVVDGRGLYFDATRESDLELLLNTYQCSDEERDRARKLQEQIRHSGVSKYNLGGGRWQRPRSARRVILVPGQVESDASIAFGAPETLTNLQLLQKVRASNPDAWLVYKPHPDVVSGARKQGAGEASAVEWCDELVVNVSTAALLDNVDEVHTLTSLTGFEALLRHKSVTCYGVPFYAGWGLTDDLHGCERRRRNLTLDELVFGALVKYPLYVSRETGEYITPETCIGELQTWFSQPAHWTSALGKLARKTINALAGSK